MFQNQHGSLVNAFRAAGLPDRASVLLARILSNNQSPYRTGPIEQDTTPRNMRQPDAEDAMTLPNLEFRGSDPYYSKLRGNESEEQEVPEPQPNVQAVIAPQQTNANHGVVDGRFTQTVPLGDNVKVDLRIKGIHDGIPVVDLPGNMLVSKGVRAESNAQGLRFFVRSNDREIVWRLAFVQEEAEPIDVVTDVSLGANSIQISKRRIYPLRVGAEVAAVDIPVVECPE